MKIIDRPVYEKLEGHNTIIPPHNALRWIMLLVCQEFGLAKCVRLWDALLADSNRFEFLLYVYVAIIVLVREDILQDDFSGVVSMETLQAYGQRVTDI